MAHTVSELPPYHSLLVVDVKDFSGRVGRDHAQITEAIPVILQSAFQRCGLTDSVWRDRRFEATTGDGYALGFPSAVLPFLLNPFLRALQDELDYREQVAAQPAALRMRVSINVGPMTSSTAQAISDGSGTSRVENHRLLDAKPVRDLLARSGPATRVAAIVSARAFQDAVLSGYAAEPPEFYIAAPVQVKTFADTAYLRVPSPTGELLRTGFLPPEAHNLEGSDQETKPAAGSSRSGRSVNNRIADVHGNAIQGGDYVQHGDTTTNHNHGPTNTGSGNQFNGDRVRYNDKRRSQ
ncbi:hypothetical protein [Allokutzneria sp. NRRL B-24872]|uniref:hypothetical protein n=1 Tax=Allokutzneria sp. NRRL B-24872 TaxID=1137961 RepID=UPI001178821C|nr:hypothetical protein [Allokutzneria sp. NRRL B-24872]